MKRWSCGDGGVVEMNRVSDELTKATNQKTSDIRRGMKGHTYMGERSKGLSRPCSFLASKRLFGGMT